MLLAHRLMGAERDNHSDRLDSTRQCPVSRAQQQRERARAGAVRHHEADAFAVEVRTGQR